MDSTTPPRDDGPIGQLNFLSDDARELILRALKEAGWPAENVDALRKYDDPRPRRTLPDGTEIIVQYVPPVPERKVVEALQELGFRSLGNPLVNTASGPNGPVYHGRGDRLLQELKSWRLKLWKALRAADWDDDRATRGKDRRTVGEKVWDSISEAPDPNDAEAWREWSEKAVREILAALAPAVERHVVGENARREETRPKDAMKRPDPETGEFEKLDPDEEGEQTTWLMPETVADLLDLSTAAREAERAAEWIDALRSVATKRDRVYVDELERLILEGVPVEEAKILAGEPLGLDANGAKQLRHRLRERYKKKVAASAT